MGLERVQGNFSRVYGRVLLDPHHLEEAQIEAVVDISSLGTGIEMRDKHLHDEDFFDVLHYPVATFLCEQVLQKGIGYVATGVLEIKGHSKVVQIPFMLHNDVEGQLLEGYLLLNRQDFGLGDAISPVMVGNEVRVSIKCYVLQ